MKDKVFISLQNGLSVVAERYCADGEQEELCVYMIDKDGVIMQDICLARQSSEVDGAQLLVWGDPYSEDYTNSFEIEKYVE